MRDFFVRSVQRGMARVGLRLARVEPFVEPVMPFDVLELAIVSLLHRPEADFYFVQVGASDGLRNDYLHPLIRCYRLAGCLVEACPDLFARLKRNYADQPQLDFRNLAIGERGGAVAAPVGVEVATFAELVAGLPERPINLLYVDTEGADDHVVKAALALGLRPEIIHYEWSEMSSERRLDLKLLLLDHGYRFIDVGADTVCYRSGQDHAR